MAHPISALTTLRPDLASFTQLDLEMQQRGYVGTRILPSFPVSTSGGVFSVIKLASLLAAANADTKRTSTGGYNQGNWEWEVRNYATAENGWEEPIDEREANMYANYLNLEEVAAARAWEHVLNSLERRIIAATVGATVTAGRTSAATAVWTNKASATPIDDVITAQDAVWLRTGMWPRTVTMSRRAFRACRLTNQVVASLNSAGAGRASNQANITKEVLAELFDVDQVIVADSIRNTANAGQAAVLDSVFPETQCLVSISAKTNDFKEPCLGRTFNWGGDGSQIQGEGMIGVAETYEMPSTRKKMLRVRHETAEFILYPEAAQVITGVR